MRPWIYRPMPLRNWKNNIFKSCSINWNLSINHIGRYSKLNNNKSIWSKRTKRRKDRKRSYVQSALCTQLDCRCRRKLENWNLKYCCNSITHYNSRGGSVSMWLVWIAGRTYWIFKILEIILRRDKANITLISIPCMFWFPIDKIVYCAALSNNLDRSASQPANRRWKAINYYFLSIFFFFFQFFAISHCILQFIYFFNRFLSVIQCQFWIMIRCIDVFIVSIDRIKIENEMKKEEGDEENEFVVRHLSSSSFRWDSAKRTGTREINRSKIEYYFIVTRKCMKSILESNVIILLHDWNRLHELWAMRYAQRNC